MDHDIFRVVLEEKISCDFCGVLINADFMLKGFNKIICDDCKKSRYTDGIDCNCSLCRPNNDNKIYKPQRWIIDD